MDRPRKFHQDSLMSFIRKLPELLLIIFMLWQCAAIFGTNSLEYAYWIPAEETVVRSAKVMSTISEAAAKHIVADDLQMGITGECRARIQRPVRYQTLIGLGVIVSLWWARDWWKTNLGKRGQAAKININ